MIMQTADITGYPTLYFISAESALEILANANETQTILLGRGFTFLKANHPTHGSILAMVNSVGPSLIYGQKRLELE